MKILKNLLTFQSIQSIGIIIAIGTSTTGVLISLSQYKILSQEIQLSVTKDSADTMLYLDNQLNSGTNRNIQKTLEYGGPILKLAGGPYTTYDVENYLDDIETLDDFYYSHLITERMVCVNFSVAIDHAYKNSEIQNYIKKVRQEENDDTIYEGLSDLYTEMLPFQGQECPN